MCVFVCVCARLLHMLKQMSLYMTSYIWRPPNHHGFHFPTISNNNMADKRICEAVATQTSIGLQTIFRNFAIIRDFMVCKIQDKRKHTVLGWSGNISDWMYNTAAGRCGVCNWWECLTVVMYSNWCVSCVRLPPVSTEQHPFFQGLCLTVCYKNWLNNVLFYVAKPMSHHPKARGNWDVHKWCMV
jgi:hypothetical protein